MRFKTCHAVKAAAGQPGNGTSFQAIVSVFDNRDAYGEVVRPGAFTNTLAAWSASGDPIPVYWSHRMDDPRFNIGHVVSAEEVGAGDPRTPEWADPWVKDHGGLLVAGLIDPDGEVAQATTRLLNSRRSTQFSFAYDVVDGGWATANGEDVYELRHLNLHEVSACQIGANDLTQLLGAKALDLVTRMAGQDPAQTRQLIDQMGTAELRAGVAQLASLLAERHDGGNDRTANDEEPSRVKSEELSRLDSIRQFSDLLCDVEITD